MSVWIFWSCSKILVIFIRLSWFGQVSIPLLNSNSKKISQRKIFENFQNWLKKIRWKQIKSLLTYFIISDALEINTQVRIEWNTFLFSNFYNYAYIKLIQVCSLTLHTSFTTVQKKIKCGTFCYKLIQLFRVTWFIMAHYRY